MLSKSLPETTEKKPRLRNTSWAKLLRQRKTGNERENIGKGAELDDPCESIFVKGKQTRKLKQNLLKTWTTKSKYFTKGTERKLAVGTEWKDY